MKYYWKYYPHWWAALKVIAQKKFHSKWCLPDTNWALLLTKRQSERSGALPIPGFEQNLQSGHYIIGQGPKSDEYYFVSWTNNSQYRTAKIFLLIQYFTEMDGRNRTVSSLKVDTYKSYLLSCNYGLQTLKCGLQALAVFSQAFLQKA